MLIHGKIASSRVNGPGVRAVLFLQGCVLNCRSCWNPRSHPFSGDQECVDELIAWILACRQSAGIMGVTFSGGEPMHQAGELLELAKRLTKAIPELSLGMFSGYSERELERGAYNTLAGVDSVRRSAVWAECRTHLDFAILGRFNDTLPAREPLRSSKNQVLRLYSTRFSASDFCDPQVEVTISEQGLVAITGFPVVGLPT